MRTALHSLDFQDLIGPQHHHKIEKLLAQLCEQARIDDPEGLREFWACFERELKAHLNEEESALLPAFAADHPHEAAALLREHDEICRRLEELGADVDLHLFRANIADDLVQRLRRHAEREDRLLYPWAATHAW